AWDQLKGRPVPRTHQEFVDSKQRLRAALRNLRTIEDVPSNDVYRRYRITDLLEIRVKTGRKEEIPEIKTEVKDIPVLPRRRGRRKVKVEKCMYTDDDSFESWTECIKPPRNPRRPVNPRKIACLKEIGECSKSVSQPSEKNSPIENPGPSNFKRSTTEESERHLEQKISPVPTKETGAVPKIKVVAAENPRLERSPKKETNAKPKLPRSLACILDSQNINYDRSIGPRRTTKVSQEVWASSLGIKQEEPTYSPEEKQMVSGNSGMTPKDSIPTAEASVKTKKKSKSGQKKKKSKGGEKKKKSTNEPSLIIKLPVKQESIEDLTVRLEAGAQSADSARPRVEQEPVENATQNRQPVAQNPFAGDINSLYSEAYLATRLDEEYLTKAWLENDRECPWFCGKGSSDVVFEIEFPAFNSRDFNTPLTSLGVRLDALEKVTGSMNRIQ
ncbi:hypothetical protein AVEN_247657-1, partial [Araneus ventricosus]